MKIDKSKLMKTAWEIAKTAQIEFGGHSSEYIAESMKIAWTEMKSTSEINIARLAEIGSEWIRGEHHRIYFNDVKRFFDDICEKPYQRRVNGVQCNKTELESKKSTSVWYDVKTGEFCARGYHFTDHDLEIVKRNILTV
jgi:hypothetical protein